MSVGFVMLCHKDLDRAAQVARHLAEQGSPVVVHVDRRVTRESFADMRDSLSDLTSVHFSQRYKCFWGTWRLVEATLAASHAMLNKFPRVSHVYLLSGACLPLRPVAQLEAFLSSHRDIDFIESVRAKGANWVVTGLEEERFTMYFPFNWQRWRGLFDASVWIQRAIGFKRRIPYSLSPHLGSQWWCLTRKTLDAMIEHPERAALKRYFKKCWIPDEGYFQTLIHHVSFKVDSRSLTYARFDFQGKPYTFYDDHLEMLQDSGAFMVRKVWPQANALYDHFLSHPKSKQKQIGAPSLMLDTRCAATLQQRQHGRSGLQMQSRFTLTKEKPLETVRPYFVFYGFCDVFEGFQDWAQTNTPLTSHGRLFAPERAYFANKKVTYAGALTQSAAIRDYSPGAFLTSLLWNRRDEVHGFQLSARDTQDVTPLIASDMNAHIHLISDAWSYGLYRANLPKADALRHAALLHKRETAFVKALTTTNAAAEIQITPLWRVLNDANEALQSLARDIKQTTGYDSGATLPSPADLEGFKAFNTQLRSAGIGVARIEEKNWDVHEKDAIIR